MEDTEDKGAIDQSKHVKQHATFSLGKSWKEYLVESALIVFSVLLALILTEVFNDINEKKKTHEVLEAVRAELIINRQYQAEQYQYHLQVLRNIDSALVQPEVANKFINEGILNLSIIAPEGAMLHDLSDIAWQVAKQNNIFSKIDLTIYKLLTEIYNNQQRITNSEDKIAGIVLSRESRITVDNRITLILIRDNYRGWAVDRAPALLKNYQKAIDALKTY